MQGSSLFIGCRDESYGWNTMNSCTMWYQSGPVEFPSGMTWWLGSGAFLKFTVLHRAVDRVGTENL